MIVDRDGGYEAGYAACPCFWGPTPGKYVSELLNVIPDVSAMRVLDAGCGEGKNAALFASRGASVTAIDISWRALRNAKSLHASANVDWVCGDVSEQMWPSAHFDIVIAYGLFHCLPSLSEVEKLYELLASCTKGGGYHVVCAFNERRQELVAHPEFRPCLAQHRFYLSLYREWQVLSESDEDLNETHPHNRIPHTHSLTRLLVRKLS